MGNTFGRAFRVTTFGESHGKAVGAVIDGCPPRIPLLPSTLQDELDRRRPGQSRLTTQRQELDQVEILSGVEGQITLGTPIALIVRNSDARSKDYREMREKFRPSHADYTYQAKYGVRALAGGGRASARETVGRVAAGAVAQAVLAQEGVEVVAWVESIANLCANNLDDHLVTRDQVEANPVRCPSQEIAQAMYTRIDAARKAGDSLGGVIRAVARGVPAGLGEPVFDKLEADLAKAMLSLPAAKGFESGLGFAATTMTGSQHNDPFYAEDGKIRTRTNHSGGIQGGISNGELITLRIAFKPTATILREQESVDIHGQATTLAGRGRHDPCVLPRAVPIVEAMVRLVLVDHLLRHRGQNG